MLGFSLMRMTRGSISPMISMNFASKLILSSFNGQKRSRMISIIIGRLKAIEATNENLVGISWRVFCSVLLEM